jgi:hypothetical protein
LTFCFVCAQRRILFPTMKPFSSLFAAIGLFSFQLVSATSVITFYSDDECTTLLGVESGPDNGTCTQFESSTSTYGSFMVTTLDQTCAGKLVGRPRLRLFDSPYEQASEHATRPAQERPSTDHVLLLAQSPYTGMTSLIVAPIRRAFLLSEAA